MKMLTISKYYGTVIEQQLLQIIDFTYFVGVTLIRGCCLVHF